MLASVALRFVRDRAAPSARSHTPDVTTLPLIDVLLVLLLFLIMAFDARGESCEHRAISLPEAVNGVALALAPVITIDGEHVRIDGRSVANVSDLAGREGAENLPALREELTTIRRNFQLLHPGEPPWNGVTVRAERGLDYRVMRKVLAVCASVGYPHASFAVERRSRAR